MLKKDEDDIHVLNIKIFPKFDDSLEEKYNKKNEIKSDWKSIVLMYIFIFLIGIQFSLFNITVYPYFRFLDPNAEFSTYIWVMLYHVLGQAVGTLFYGFVNTRYKTYNNIFLMAIGYLIVGNILYLFLSLFPISFVQYLLSVSRYLVGYGCGILGVSYAYCIGASKEEDRKTVTYFSTASYITGVATGHLLFSIFRSHNMQAKVYFCRLIVNKDSLPSLLMAFLYFIYLLIFLYSFKEKFYGIEYDKNKKLVKYCQSLFEMNDKMKGSILIFNWFVITLLFYTLESFPIYWTELHILFRNSWKMLTFEIITGMIFATAILTSLMIALPLLRRIKSTNMITFGFALIFIYNLINYPLPFYNNFEISPEANTTFKNIYSFNGNQNVPFELYVLSAISCLGIGISVIFSGTLYQYSKILGQRRQSFMISLLQFLGCVAQVITLCMILIIEHYNVSKCYMIIFGVLSLIALILNGFFYERKRCNMSV
uniref:MFS domain-containing protein n=1 Tax=Parastrongyloides trichosuri TaxID=131310 RepID=A0A0N5A6S3_PARTI